MSSAHQNETLLLLTNTITLQQESIILLIFRGAFQGLYSAPAQSWIYAIALCLSALTIHAVIVRLTHLRHYPGPWWAAYTRLWLSKTIASGNSAKIFVNINKKYGSLARIGPNNLLTDDPELTRRVLAARSHYTRGPWFDSIKIDPHVPNIVSERHPGKHNHLRYQMSAGYAGKDITGLEPAINERITDFMNRIDENWVSKPGQTKPFDIAKRIQFLAVDIITHLCFGKPLGFAETDSDVYSFLKTIETQLPIVQHFSVFLELNDILLWFMDIPWLKKLIAPSANDKAGIGMIMGVRISLLSMNLLRSISANTDQISRKVVDERFVQGAIPKNDMLGSFIKHGLTASEAETEISISLCVASAVYPAQITI